MEWKTVYQFPGNWTKKKVRKHQKTERCQTVAMHQEMRRLFAERNNGSGAATILVLQLQRRKEEFGSSEEPTQKSCKLLNRWM
jgi:adenylate kinase